MFNEEELLSVQQGSKNWEEKRQKVLNRFPERKDTFTTASGIEVKPLYTPQDLEQLNYNRDLGFPGEYPFTRGIHPTMYRGRLWSMRQYSGFGTAEESNRRYKYLLEQGQTGLSIAFDLPTQIGYDSDHPMSEGEVGKVGVAIDSLDDMERLLAGIPLDKVSTSMTINAPAAVLLAMYIAVAEKQGIAPEKLNGTVQNDILKEYIARGTYIFPPRPSLRLVTDTFAYCSKHTPNWNVISVGAYHIREAGSTAVQEVAFAFANAIAYIEAALKAGLDIDAFAPRISWIFNTYNNFFEEIAKYRAARRLWARMMKERFGARNPKSCMFRIHIQNGGSSLTAQQPLNNVIRGTIHALASVLGGTQSLAICSYDEALALPTEESVQLSLRTQQIIAYESGVTATPDPLAGSYYVESLTTEIERQVEAYLEKIDALGGALPAIEAGYMQKEIQESAYRYQKELEEGTRVVVGVNKFQTDKTAEGQWFRVNDTIARTQRERLTTLRNKRDNRAVKEALARLADTAANEDENIVPVILEAVRAYATLGEICGVLRQVYGEYHPVQHL
jgi:methylmalonyl-CoA mutase N-terminal domain/subunit